MEGVLHESRKRVSFYRWIKGNFLHLVNSFRSLGKNNASCRLVKPSSISSNFNRFFSRKIEQTKIRLGFEKWQNKSPLQSVLCHETMWHECGKKKCSPIEKEREKRTTRKNLPSSFVWQWHASKLKVVTSFPSLPFWKKYSQQVNFPLYFFKANSYFCLLYLPL